jgi:hypothetical protein
MVRRVRKRKSGNDTKRSQKHESKGKKNTPSRKRTDCREAAGSESAHQEELPFLKKTWLTALPSALPSREREKEGG